MDIIYRTELNKVFLMATKGQIHSVCLFQFYTVKLIQNYDNSLLRTEIVCFIKNSVHQIKHPSFKQSFYLECLSFILDIVKIVSYML